MLPAQVPADARLYTKLASDRPGRQAVWRDRDGSVNVVYQHSSPGGCQTDIRSTISVDVVGAIVYLQHTGTACEPRRIVNESYTRSGSLGVWRTGRAQGQGDTIGKKFYVSAHAVPEERAMLVRALLAGGHQLTLLPAGEARLERVEQLTVRAGDRAELVTHYRVYGAAQEPIPVWLDRTSELFALGPDLIRQGWEAAAEVLRIR